MKFITLAAALAAVLPAAFGLTVNTPANVAECEPTQITWGDGTEPYYLTFVPAGQISAAAIKQFPTQTSTSYTWLVDLASGTSFTIALKDSTGASAYSDIVTIVAGTSSSCLNSSVQETGGSGSSASVTSGGSGTTPAGASATSAGSSGSATSAAASSTATHSSGADHLSVSSAFGIAGILSLVGAALF